MSEKKSWSDQILDAPPATRAKITIENGKVVKQKKREKRLYFTKSELISFLVKNQIKSVVQLKKLRRPEQDPNHSHYFKEFGENGWQKALRAAYSGSIPEKAPKTGRYIIETMVRFKLYTSTQYRRFRKEHPDILPSYKSLLKEFPSFKYALKTAHYHSLQDMAYEFLKLKRKLGRMPTYEDCSASNIDLTRLLRVFKKKSSFDEFIKDIDNVRMRAAL